MSQVNLGQYSVPDTDSSPLQIFYASDVPNDFLQF